MSFSATFLLTGIYHAGIPHVDPWTNPGDVIWKSKVVVPGVLLEQMGKVKAMAVAALGSVGRLVKVVPGQKKNKKKKYIDVPRAQILPLFLKVNPPKEGLFQSK